MAFTVTNRGVADSGTTDQATITVGAFTPTADSLLIFFGHAENNSGSAVNPVASTPTGGSLTYTLISKLDGASAVSDSGYEKTGGVWRAPVGGSPGSMSVVWDGSDDSTCWYTAGALDITGHDTGTPIAQVATPQGADTAGASNPAETVTLTSTPTTDNLVVACFSTSVVTASAMADPTIGGQTMTRVHGTDTNDYEQHITYYRVITGAESNAVITCSDMGGTENYATLAFAFEVAAAADNDRTGTVAVTQADQTVVASGTVTVPTITGTVSVTQADQTVVASGTFTPSTITGTVSVTQADQTVVASGAVTVPTITGTVSVTQADQTVVASGFEVDAGLWPTTVSSRLVLDQAGDAWQLIGDAAWSVLGQLTAAEMDTYLDGVNGYGFNCVMVSLIENQYSDDPPNNYNGDGPYSGTMFQSSTVEAYWSHVDTFIEKCAALGITVLAAPVYLGFNTDGVAAELDAASNAQALAYGEFVGNRYAAYPNVLWMAGGDRTSVSATTADRVDNVMTGVTNKDANHLVTGHTADGATADDVWGSYSWLDINTAYEVADSPVNASNAGSASDAYNDAPTRPVFYVEGKYEGDTTRSPTAGYGSMLLRYQMWGPVLAGSIGAVFGNGVRWHYNSTNAGAYAQTGVTWQESLDDTDGDDDLGTIHVGVLATFVASFTRAEWGALVADTTDTFLTGGEGTGSSIAAAAFSTDHGLVYFPDSRGSITVDTTELDASNPVRLRWFDPTDGSYTLIVASEAQSSSRAVTHPGTNGNSENDWVLVVDLTDDRTGTVSVTQADQTVVASGTFTPPPISGTVSVTQADQTVVASGSVTVPAFTGTVSVTQGNQTVVASGTFTPPPITGTVSVTQADQTVVATGTVSAPGAVTGTVAATQADQTVVASGTFTPATITGTVSVTQADQTSAASGTHTPPPISGSVAVTQADQTVVATGTVVGPGVVSGTVSVTQADQTVVASGTFTPPPITGTVSVTQADQTVIATGTFTPFGVAADTIILSTYREHAFTPTYREHAFTPTYRAGA